MNQDLLHIRNALRENGILISFSGRLSQALIEEYGEAVKKYLESEEVPKNDIYQTFAVFIEQTQNIKNYCSSKLESENYEEISGSCIVTIGKTESSHFIYSGNLLENEDIPKLVRKLDLLKTLDKTQLKQLYKETLKKDFQPEETGAGIGLIDIARKASMPLEYSITEVGNSLSFFMLKAVV
jgi:hypothetical protein